ncbi:hypothetical protein REPUB_Repub10bG0059000 [Reevesia pubescens]
MACSHNLMSLSQLVLLLVLFFITGSIIVQVKCFNLNYPVFNMESSKDFILSQNSYIGFGALQLTPDVSGISNVSGRILYNQPFKLDNRRGLRASFVSTFVFNIWSMTSPVGDGLAFILTEQISTPKDSGGQYLGIINCWTTGLSNIVAVEFDTRKSNTEDIDDNHVGIDVRSTVSMNSKSLSDQGLNLSSGNDIMATVEYDAKSTTMRIFVSSVNIAGGESMKKPILSQVLDLTTYLPKDVYVGFSASTGVNATQLNAVKSWNFTSFETLHKKSFRSLWIGVLISGLTISLLIVVFLFTLYRKRKHQRELVEDDDPEIERKIQSSSTAPQKFHLKELKVATENFSLMNKLGMGGFGTVYKGVMSNKAVAVKRISKNSHHGKQDFIAEVTSIGNLHHKNLVKLIGWCYESNELLLVYEFMPNGSLDKFIFRNDTGDVDDTTLTWERRHNIICGVAQALNYLHNGCEKRVLHRDIKASNIMLDLEFNARLGDFGLARVIQLNEKTHHSTKEIAGTPGYMAPESFHTGRATVETDVYAFGVLILETVCGRRPGHQCEVNNCNSIVDWVWENYRMDRLTFVSDTRINEDADQEQIKSVLMLGLACCHPNPYERPAMKTALQVLTGEAEPPEVVVEKPAFMWPVLTPLRDVECSPSGAQFTATTELSGR